MKDIIFKFILKLIKEVGWRGLIVKVYYEFIREELVKLASKTDNKIDDKAIECLDYLIDKFFKN